MKTIRAICIASLALSAASCTTYYRMVTVLDRNGTAHREVYALFDSVYRARDASENPFLFDPGSDWTVTRFDAPMKYDFFGAAQKLNVKAGKTASSIADFSKEIRPVPGKRPFAAPAESLTRHAGWFYTRYVFEAVYGKIPYDAPVPIGNYLTPEEQALWTQGGMESYKALNGAEMNDLLGGIGEKFGDWYSRNCFEISLASIRKYAVGYGNLEADKDRIFLEIHKKDEGVDINPETVCKALDVFYKTSYFSVLYRADKELLNKDFEETTSLVESIGTTISYELGVPGRVLATNAPITKSDTLVWKADGMRMLFADYTLTAEYRVANLWGFAVAGSICAAALAGGIVLLCRKRAGKAV